MSTNAQLHKQEYFSVVKENEERTPDSLSHLKIHRILHNNERATPDGVFFTENFSGSPRVYNIYRNII